MQKNNQGSKDPLHGITLQVMLEDLESTLGWEYMSQKIPINCFINNPSIKSSLAFLRKTPWARQKIEVMYKYNINKILKAKQAQQDDHVN